MNGGISPKNPNSFNTSVTSSSGSPTGSPKPVTPEQFIEDLQISVFDQYDHQSDDQKAQAIVNKIIGMSQDPRFNLTRFEQIEFLENVFSKLDFLNDGLKAESAQARSEVKESFKTALPIIEAGLLAHINDNLYNRHKDLNDRIFEKISSLDFSENPVLDKKALAERANLYRSIHFNSPSSVVVDANGEHYTKVNDVVKDGNCGLNACKTTTDRSGKFNANVERAYLLEVKKEHDKLHAYGNARDAAIAQNPLSISNPVFVDVKLKLMFGNLENCKAFLDKILTEKLLAVGLGHSTKQNLQALQLMSQTTTSLNELFQDHDVLMFIHKNLAFEFSTTADRPNDWLTNGDVKAIMLSKGYYCTDDGLRKDGKQSNWNAQTVLKFEHLVTGKEAYIANNSTPLPETQSVKQKEGTHWVCVEKAGAPQA